MTRVTADISPESAQEASGDSGKDNSPSSAIADCWEDAVDSGKLSSPFKTNNQQNDIASDKEEILDDEEEKEDIVSDLEKIKIRKKTVAQPADVVKKEHVNLVIIGHVGEFLTSSEYTSCILFLAIVNIDFFILQMPESQL